MMAEPCELNFVNDNAYDSLWKMYYRVIHEPFDAMRLPSWHPFWGEVTPNKMVEEQLVDDFKPASKHK